MSQQQAAQREAAWAWTACTKHARIVSVDVSTSRLPVQPLQGQQQQFCQLRTPLHNTPNSSCRTCQRAAPLGDLALSSRKMTQTIQLHVRGDVNPFASTFVATAEAEAFAALTCATTRLLEKPTTVTIKLHMLKPMTQQAMCCAHLRHHPAVGEAHKGLLPTKPNSSCKQQMWSTNMKSGLHQLTSPTKRVISCTGAPTCATTLLLVKPTKACSSGSGVQPPSSASRPPKPGGLLLGGSHGATSVTCMCGLRQQPQHDKQFSSEWSVLAQQIWQGVAKPTAATSPT